MSKGKQEICKHGISPYDCPVCTAERERNAEIVKSIGRNLKTLVDSIRVSK